MTVPQRTTGSLTLAFGLTAIECQTYAGTEETAVRRSRFSPSGNPVGIRNYDKVTDDEVAYADIVSKVETEHGWIELDDDEVARAASGTANGCAEVLAFVPAPLLRSYEQTGLMQIRPARGATRDKAPNPATVKAYGLLMRAMETCKVFALVSYTLRGKPRLGALTPDGFLRELAYADQIREALPMPEVTASKAEVALAVQLIKALTEKAAPIVTDEASARVRAYAELKATPSKGKARRLKAVPTPAGDLVASLQASLKATPKKRKVG